MRAGELGALLASLYPAVRQGKTVDGFKWGSPDADLIVIVVGHAASEAYRMIGMVDLLREHFADLRVEYLSAGNGFAVR